LHETNGFNLFSEDEPRIGVIIGTGPGLTQEQLNKVSHLRKFGANRAFEFGLDVLHACNYQFWDYYWSEVKDLPCHKWTTRPELKDKLDGLNYIEERWIEGLSTNKAYIAAHHGTGPQLVNLAYHYGVKQMILIGWDMRHKGKRHYFGEYPQELQHFTRNLGPNGELLGLIKEMETIHPERYDIEIINCTPGSAMTCFPPMDIDECLTYLQA
jgi:hypothetical protein